MKNNIFQLIEAIQWRDAFAPGSKDLGFKPWSYPITLSPHLQLGWFIKDCLRFMQLKGPWDHSKA
jgi:hypothetical protein